MAQRIKTQECSEYYFKERCFIRELLNSSEEPQLSIAQARVEPGVTTVWHSLTGTEVYYILAGKGLAEVSSEKYQVERGHLVHISAGEPQRITNTGEEDLIFLAICAPRFTPENYTELDLR